jgi:hypothetical protein
MNQTLALLLDTCDGEDEDAMLRALAYRAGLLWHCEECGCDNPGDLSCEQCRREPPEDTPEAPRLMVVPVVSKTTGVTVAVYDTDDEDGAASVVEWFNSDGDLDLVTTGEPIPYNTRPGEYLDDVFCTAMPEAQDDEDEDVAAEKS